MVDFKYEFSKQNMMQCCSLQRRVTNLADMEIQEPFYIFPQLYWLFIRFSIHTVCIVDLGKLNLNVQFDFRLETIFATDQKTLLTSKVTQKIHLTYFSKVKSK